MSTNFGSKDGILIRTMTLEDYKHVEGTVYNDVPISCFGDHDSKDILSQSHSFFRNTHIRLIEQGTCLVAINEEDGGRIVGLLLAGGQDPSHNEKLGQRAAEMAPCALKTFLQFLAELRSKINAYEHYGVSKLLYVNIINVIASMRGKGIGGRLTSALMEVGRSKGFPLMAATCISFYSARQMMALGMECFYSMAYSDYKDQNGQVVFNPPAPHTHVHELAIKL